LPDGSNATTQNFSGVRAFVGTCHATAYERPADVALIGIEIRCKRRLREKTVTCSRVLPLSSDAW
jgi:hypothetical protein